MYDCTHYYLHHGFPSKEPARHLKVRRNMSKLESLHGFVRGLNEHLMPHFASFQRYHLNHHFRIQNKGFGITSSLWDFVLGTLPPASSTQKKSS
ncbi:Fatty acid 2-hydroxylase 2 [Platanthera guangdongensis]|uniref:Fatty acid 2-hydroxylase 2 n=1 Tax=Platanthera guangdongensis TaxID=2320717 RepID=A0ABR2LWW3_9ASPA